LIEVLAFDIDILGYNIIQRHRIMKLIKFKAITLALNFEIAE